MAFSDLYYNAVIADTPYWYYRCTDSSGATLTDHSGNTRNGVISGTVSYQQPSLCTCPFPGDIDYSLLSDGSTGYIEGVGFTPTDFETITLEAAISLPVGNQAINTPLIMYKDTSQTAGLFLFNSSNTIGWYNVSSGVSLGISAPTDGRPHLYTLVATDTNVLVYIDGRLKVTTSNSVTLNSARAVSAIRVNRWPNGTTTMAASYVDEFSLYRSTALSATRIAVHASAFLCSRTESKSIQNNNNIHCFAPRIHHTNR